MADLDCRIDLNALHLVRTISDYRLKLVEPLRNDPADVQKRVDRMGLKSVNQLIAAAAVMSHAQDERAKRLLFIMGMRSRINGRRMDNNRYDGFLSFFVASHRFDMTPSRYETYPPDCWVLGQDYSKPEVMALTLLLLEEATWVVGPHSTGVWCHHRNIPTTVALRLQPMSEWYSYG